MWTGFRWLSIGYVASFCEKVIKAGNFLSERLCFMGFSKHLKPITICRLLKLEIKLEIYKWKVSLNKICMEKVSLFISEVK
jgi:hypothetical protein